MIEEFDPVQEAFNLLDVREDGELTVDTFRNIFEKLHLGTIDPNEEKIFLDVADKDGDGKITLEDFRKILDCDDDGDEEDDIGGAAMHGRGNMIEEGDMEGMDGDEEEDSDEEPM